MEHAHDLILLGGALGLLSIFAGLVSARVNAPLLLVFLEILRFGFGMPGSASAAWVGRRGAVPIDLTIIPVLQGAPGGERLFGIAFGTVVASLVVQDWTIRQAAALLGFDGVEH